LAKRAIEMAIEEDEAAAMDYLERLEVPRIYFKVLPSSVIKK
jgi:hypothetical protein